MIWAFETFRLQHTSVVDLPRAAVRNWVRLIHTDANNMRCREHKILVCLKDSIGCLQNTGRMLDWYSDRNENIIATLEGSWNRQCGTED